MLELEVPGREFFNDATQEFVESKPTTIRLEHSLVSISKWESKWKKPFLKQREGGFSRAEIEDYVRCMTITQNVPEEVFTSIGADELEKVNAYINDPMSATTFNEIGSRPNRQVVTSELIYYWMTVHQIPWEAQKWHLNRLLTLIRVCNNKNGKQKKMSPKAIMAQNSKLNAQRRAASGSRG